MLRVRLFFALAGQRTILAQDDRIPEILTRVCFLILKCYQLFDEGVFGQALC